MEYSKEDLMEAKKQIWGVGENMGTEESKKIWEENAQFWDNAMGDGIHFATQKRVSIRKLRKSVQQPFSLRCRFRRNRRPQHGEGVLAPPFTREPGLVP